MRQFEILLDRKMAKKLMNYIKSARVKVDGKMFFFLNSREKTDSEWLAKLFLLFEGPLQEIASNNTK